MAHPNFTRNESTNPTDMFQTVCDLTKLVRYFLQKHLP